MGKLVVILAVSAVLSASCRVDVTDAPGEPVGAAVEPGIHRGDGATSPPDPVTTSDWWLEHHQGPCADACYDIATDLCDWQDVCADVAPSDDAVTCAGEVLSCAEAQHAANGETWGLEWCWRSCAGIR
jgi:hypothetical protein